MQEKYNQEIVINEKNMLKIDRDRVIRNSLIGSIVLLCCIGVLIFVYQRKLIKKQRIIQEHEEQLRRYTLKIHENESLISRNENRINELVEEMHQNKDVQELVEEQQFAIIEIQNQNNTLYKENRELHESISQYSASLRKHTQEIDTFKSLSKENQFLRDRERFLCNQLIKQTKLLNSLKIKPKHLDVVAWEEMFTTINWLFYNFTERLTKEFPALTVSEIQLCCLIKLRIPVADIATIATISPTSVSKKKQRLKDKIIEGLGKPFEESQTLDLWLLEY